MSTAASLVTSAVDSTQAHRAIYWSAANNFQKGQPDVPCHVFVAERDRALDEGTGTALIPLDLSDRLGLGYPASVPNLLARYVRVDGGDEIAYELASSGEAYYVMEGSGEAEKGDDRFDWATGDVFVLPGAGGSTRIRADAGGALLWMVTDEPALAYFGVEKPPFRDEPGAVHYPAGAIEVEMSQIHQRVDDGRQSGKAVLFSRADLEANHLATPTVAFAYNSLAPEDDQPPHRHNAAALTPLRAGRGRLLDGGWAEGGLAGPRGHGDPAVGPSLASQPGAGDDVERRRQDGGVFYNARTLGYSPE